MTLGQAYNVIRNNRILDNGTTRQPTPEEIQKAKRILIQAGHRIEDIEPPTLSGMLNEGIGALQGATESIGDFFAPVSRAVKQGYMDFMKDGPIYPTPTGEAIPPAPEPEPFDTLQYKAFAAEQGEQDRLQGMRKQAARSGMPMTTGSVPPPMGNVPPPLAQPTMIPPASRQIAPPETSEVAAPPVQNIPPMAQEPLMEPPVFRTIPSPRERQLTAAKATYGLGGPTALEDNLLPSEIEMRAIRRQETAPKEDENETYESTPAMERALDETLPTYGPGGTASSEGDREAWLARLLENSRRLSAQAGRRS